MKTFPNGFTSWQETHFEIVTAITRQSFPRVDRMGETHPHGAIYELVEELTDKFESEHNDIADGEYFETLFEFLEEQLK